MHLLFTSVTRFSHVTWPISSNDFGGKLVGKISDQILENLTQQILGKPADCAYF